jgi:hypothetical protein
MPFSLSRDLVIASLVSDNVYHMLQATSVVQVRQTVSEPLHTSKLMIRSQLTETQLTAQIESAHTLLLSYALVPGVFTLI